MFISQLLFWIAAVLLIYIYLGYPVVIWAWARMGKRSRVAALQLAQHNSAKLKNLSYSLLVIAHNEESRIQARIDNLLALDHSPDLIEIVIASDGSTDQTVRIARACQSHTLRVVEFTQQRGKPAVLNQLVPRLRGEVAVLLDVRQRIEPPAIQTLLEYFGDPGVGAVSGELMLEQSSLVADGPAVAEGVDFYWRYEKFIRQQESRVDSTVGVTGALYAIRRALFQPIPEQTLLDDVLIPMQIARRGYQVKFASTARAYDQLASSSKAEFTRKVRTIAGNFQLFFLHPWLLNPWRNRLWFQTLSHKFLRLLSPLCLLLALAVNSMLLDQRFYQCTFAAQGLFYLAAASACLTRFKTSSRILLRVPHAFCLLNWATLVGFSRFVFRSQRVTWQKSGI